MPFAFFTIAFPAIILMNPKHFGFACDKYLLISFSSGIFMLAVFLFLFKIWKRREYFLKPCKKGYDSFLSFLFFVSALCLLLLSLVLIFYCLCAGVRMDNYCFSVVSFFIFSSVLCMWIGYVFFDRRIPDQRDQSEESYPKRTSNFWLFFLIRSLIGGFCALITHTLHDPVKSNRCRIVLVTYFAITFISALCISFRSLRCIFKSNKKMPAQNQTPVNFKFNNLFRLVLFLSVAAFSSGIYFTLTPSYVLIGFSLTIISIMFITIINSSLENFLISSSTNDDDEELKKDIESNSQLDIVSSRFLLEL